MAEKFKLTKTTIAKAEPGEKDRFVWDTDLRGFGVKITKSGVKSYVMQRRVGTKERRITIARVEDLSPEVARKQALELAGAFAKGVDPVAEKQKQKRRGMTLKEAFNAYRDAPAKKGGGKGLPKKEQTKRDIDKAAKRFADWLDKPVTEIKGEMVKERHSKIAATSPAQANLAMRYLRAALNHLNADSDDEEPVIARNPVDRLNRANLWKPVKRAEGVIPADRLADWVKVVSTGLVGLKWEKEHRDALLFMLLTGCRHSEALGNSKDDYPPLAWRDVDLSARLVTFHNTKNRAPHIQPIGPKLAAILDSRKALSGPTWVFSNANDEVSEDIRSAVDRVKTATGLHITAHDLRRTFSSVSTYRVGVSEYMLKSLLNHSKTGDVTAGYVRITPEDMRHAMEQIESVLLT